MEHLEQFLSTDRPWIHTCAPDVITFDFAGRLRELPPFVYIAALDGRRMRSPAGLFAEFARALRFPDYFGHNWDALDECLNDLNWLMPLSSHKPVVVLVADAEELLQNEPELKKLLRLLSSTSVAWNQPPKEQNHGRARGRFILYLNAAQNEASRRLLILRAKLAWMLRSWAKFP